MARYAFPTGTGSGWALVTSAMSAEQLSAIGAVECVEHQDPSLHWIDGYELADVDGVPHLTYLGEPWSIERARTVRLQELDSEFKARINRGFPAAVYFPALFSAGETLQVRNPDDKVNWTRVLIRAQRAVDQGRGDELLGLPLRATSNAMFAVTNSQAIAVMDAGELWVAGMMGRNWLLADAVRVSATQEALDALPIGGGWPGDTE